MVTATRPRRAPHAFGPRDYVGGHPVIDFVNTVTARNTVAPADRLDGYPALLRWASLSALALPDDATADDAAADDAAADDAAADDAAADDAAARDGEPAGARSEVQRCRALREALHAILTARQDGGPVPEGAVGTLQASWRHAAAHARLEVSPSGPIRLRHDGSGPWSSVVRRAVAAAAVGLLADLPPGRLRTCPGERCGWIFLDTSKAGRRRWCDMATCGTADKNRHRRRPSDPARR